MEATPSQLAIPDAVSAQTTQNLSKPPRNYAVRARISPANGMKAGKVAQCAPTFKPCASRRFSPLVVAFLRQRAGRLDGLRRARDPRLRSDGSAMATAGLFLATQFLPAFSHRRWSPGSSFCAAAARCPGSTPPRPPSSACSRSPRPSSPSSSSSSSRRSTAPSPRRRAPSRGRRRRRCSPRGGRCARETRCSTSLSPEGPRRARRSPGSRSPLGRPGALLGDAVSFLLVAILVARGAGPGPRRSRRRPTWSNRLREGIAYVRGRVDLRRLILAEAGRDHLLRPDRPDRGRLRDRDAGRGRRRLRRAARRMGGGDVRRGAGLRRRAGALASLAARGLDARDRARLPRRRRRADARDRLRRGGRRRRRQRRPMGRPRSARCRS